MEFFDESPTFGIGTHLKCLWMEKPWIFLINPTAGRGLAGRRWKVLQPLVETSGVPYSVLISQTAGHFTSLAREVCSIPCHRLVIIGGDGSMHEALNGLMASSLPAEQLPILMHFPAGSGNDWARYWQIPKDPVRWWQEANQWPVFPHAIGRIHYNRDGQQQERYFLNVAGLAYDAWLVKQIELNPSAKGHPFIYLVSLLRWLFKYKPQSAEVMAGGQTRKGRFYTINAGICPFSGGGMQVVPHARPDGDKLALTIAGNLPLPRILINLWRFYNGTIGMVRGVETLFGENLEVRSQDHLPFYVEADGEWLGECPCRITVIPGAFQISAPGPIKP